jgi:valine--pyruvate aminotransferase
MQDLGEALNVNPAMIFMGGGNPARIPAAEALFQAQFAGLAADPQRLHKLLGVYQSPQGDERLLDAAAALLRREFGWDVSPAHLALANGSQPAFFILFNLFAGESAQGFRRIHLPLAPEYLGYADVGLAPDFFHATRPTIELLDHHQFKYRVDFAALQLDDSAAALCVSRPTNPTGNVLTDAEIAQLDQMARARGIPLIIDGAYGTPFPNILFAEATPHWNDNTIVVLSLSKLGLPGVRTALVVANPEVIAAFTCANTLISLAGGNLGPALTAPLFESGAILALSNNVIRPYYHTAMQRVVAQFDTALAGLPYRIHKPEGAIFLWLWFEGLPISSGELYQRLKARGVLVVDGSHFFVGLGQGDQGQEDWRHRHECIRVTYCQDPDKVAQGVTIIAEEVRRAFAEG